MFEIRGTTILISRGDTGLVTIHNIGRELTENDRVQMTIARKSGGAIYRKIQQPDSEGRVQFPLLNTQTAKWREGEYEWDIRVVLNATVSGDEITDGQEVATPIRPSRFIVLDVVGRVALDGDEEPQPTDQSGIVIDVQSFVGPQGPKGETGNSGVHIGRSAPTDPNVNVWVNPEGDAGGYASYELIETVTMTEEAALTRSAEPDGTPYAFREMIVGVKAPAETAITGQAIRFNMLGEGANIDAWIGSCVSSANVQRGFAGIKKLGGILEIYALYFNRENVVSSKVATLRASAGTSVNRVSTTGVLPVGVVVEIWGVRA